MDVSIIVPAYNAARTIGACLEGLIRQTVPRERYEIIVVDDGSRDETREMAGKHRVHLIVQPHQGPAAARNRGVAEAKGELVLFTDADCVPAQSWVEKMVRAFDDAQVMGVKGAYRTRQKGIIPRFVQCEYEHRYRRMAKQSRIDFVDTYAAGYRRRVFLEEGGFDVRYPNASVEDQDLSFRLAERGCKMVFAPKAVVYHQHPRTLVAYFRRKFNIGYWKVMVLQRHPQKAVRDSHTPQSLKLQIVLAFMLVPLLAVSPWLLLLDGALFGVTVLPFAVRASRENPMVGLASPLLVLLRAVALGLGMLAGGWDLVVGKLRG